MNIFFALEKTAGQDLGTVQRYIAEQNLPKQAYLPPKGAFEKIFDELIKEQAKLTEVTRDVVRSRGFALRKFTTFTKYRQAVSSYSWIRNFNVAAFLKDYPEPQGN